MTVLMCSELLSGVARDRTGHAMAAAAAAAELLAGDRQHFDPRLRELRVRRLVALVGDDDARLERHDVVAVVPLGALGLELVAGGRHDLQVVDPERVPDLVEEGTLRYLGADAAVAVRPVEDRQDLRDDRLVDRDDVAVAE